jgi:hypothetical protein
LATISRAVAGSRTLDPGDFSRAALERLGFVGFVRVDDLRVSRPVAAPVPPDAIGVYLAFRDSDRPVSFLRSSPAGQWRGDLTLPLATLRSRWIPESRVVYIGKAERPTPRSENSLRKRVSAYIRFGAGSNARHSGGYPTWQLADSASLLIAWRVIEPPRSPSGYEGTLIDAHRQQFGAIPFANSLAPALGD